MMPLHRDERGIVASWLIKVILGIAVIGLVFVEGGSILFAKFSAQDAAETGANAGIEALASNPRDCQGAVDVASAKVHERDPEIRVVAEKTTCLPGGSFRMRVRKEAATIVVGRISAISDWATVEGDATADPAAPGF
jgi:hypothetical protein